MKNPKLQTTALAIVLLFARYASAEIQIDYGAFIENDLRVYVDRVDEPGIGRNQTSLGGDLRVDLLPDKLRLVGDLQFVWTGFTRDTEFEGLTKRSEVAPYYLESDAAYIEVLSLLPGLDMRVGRQIVQWGAADMFNPTNNLNALDLEDPLEFGELIANQMLRLDWAPGDNFVFTGVWVPVFQPAMLPGSALLAIGDPAAEFPFANPATRLEAEKLRNVWLRNPDSYVVYQPNVTTRMPDFSLANSQFGLKMLWTAGLFDMSLSYYQGRDSMPVPTKSASSTRTTDEVSPEGAPKIGVDTDVTLVYPEKKVVGFDLAGQLPFLDDAGFWFEGAFVFPEPVKMSFDVTEVAPGSRVIVDYTVKSDSFFKYTTGLDYTIDEHFFITGQFIHGFVDEFGAHKINNYWVGGLDVKVFQERLLLRLFFLGEIPHEDDDVTLDEDQDGLVDSDAIGATADGTIASYVVFPQITYKPLDGLELTLGGYFLLGHKESKFAQDAAGPSLVVFRARASF
jgi:hypothetical protein